MEIRETSGERTKVITTGTRGASVTDELAGECRVRIKRGQEGGESRPQAPRDQGFRSHAARKHDKGRVRTRLVIDTLLIVDLVPKLGEQSDEQ